MEILPKLKPAGGGWKDIVNCIDAINDYLKSLHDRVENLEKGEKNAEEFNVDSDSSNPVSNPKRGRK